MVSEQRVFLFADFDLAAAELYAMCQPLSAIPSTSPFPAPCHATVAPHPLPHPQSNPSSSTFTNTLSSKPTHLRNQHLIPRRNAHGQAVPLLIHHPGPDGQHVRLVQLLDRAVREEDAAGGFSVGFDALDEHAVEQRRERADGFEGGGLDGGEGGLAMGRGRGWGMEEAYHCGRSVEGWMEGMAARLSIAMNSSGVDE